MKKSLLFIFISFIFLSANAQFQDATFMVRGHTLPYQIMFPKNYDKNLQYPLVVFLHGAGERGNDNKKQLANGVDKFLINNFYNKYPAIVIAPQCPTDSYWSNVQSNTAAGERVFKFEVSDKPTEAMETLIDLIRDWVNSDKVNPRRVYVGGLSMGGMGTYELLWRMPDEFTAAFVICGGGNVSKVKESTYNVPLWIFHGDSDSVVPVKAARDMYANLKDAGYNVKYTEYKGVNHNSWENALQEKELAPFLYSYSKSK